MPTLPGSPGHLERFDQPPQIPSKGVECGVSDPELADPELPGDKGEKGGGKSEALFAQLVIKQPTSQRPTFSQTVVSVLPSPKQRDLMSLEQSF